LNSELLDRQRESFNNLVESGVYSADFEHSERAKAFVSTVLDRVVARRAWSRPITVLDCGCGTGAWLQFIHERLRSAGHTNSRLCGFDLSDRMVEVARQKLGGVADPADLRAGNALERESFAFPGIAGGFDLIFTYDVVQQLPRQQQFGACLAIAQALAPGGTSIVFDNDAETRFGRRMAFRKFMTRYFGLKLVPRYYCNAAYPPLDRFRRRLAEAPAWRAEIVVSASGIKRALLIERRASAALEGGR
jgi:SAM-dependent methyltransferase